MSSLTVFLDASVILSGLASSSGGSGLLLTAAKKKKLKLITTPLILNEVHRHLGKLKLTSKQLITCLDQKLITLKNNPPPALIQRCAKLTTDPDDAHVLAGAINCHCRFLLTLDKKHLANQKVNQSLKPLRIFTPKQFWKYLKNSANWQSD